MDASSLSPTVAQRLHAGLEHDPESGCALWTGGKNDGGYGVISIATSKPAQAHRVAWILERGEIPKGLWVRHRCGVRTCCNVAHLFLAARGSQLTIAERIEQASIPEPNSGCWLWLKCTVGEGRYGRLSCDGIPRQAHIASWEAKNGRRVPTGLLVRHKCDVSLCVNPDHLETGTHADNMRDRNARGRTARGARHGHSKLRAAL